MLFYTKNIWINRLTALMNFYFYILELFHQILSKTASQLFAAVFTDIDRDNLAVFIEHLAERFFQSCQHIWIRNNNLTIHHTEVVIFMNFQAIDSCVANGSSYTSADDITEGIFNIKGVGGTLYSAIIRGDGPMVVSFTTVLVLVFIVSNLLVDLLYAALDPRIRYA